MKKSILAIIAAIAVSGVASAATINWQSGVLYTPASATGGNTTTKAKATVNYAYYLITAGEYAALDGAELKDLVDATKGKTADASGKSVATTSKANWSWGNADAGTTYYALAVYSTEFTDASGTTTLYIADVQSVKASATGATAASAEFATGKTWGSISTTPVPEPTTVALLALGLAAVGLKRKVA